jgi:CheY-like chemotaxis protein
MLRKEGFTVLEATDGLAAVELLRKHTDSSLSCSLMAPCRGWRVRTAFSRPGGFGPICA